MTHYTSSMWTDTVYTAVGNVAAVQQDAPKLTLTSPRSTDHVAKIQEQRHQLLPYSPGWTCTAWAEISVLLFLLCCCHSTRSTFRPCHCAVDPGSAARVKPARSSALIGITGRGQPQAPRPVMWNPSPRPEQLADMGLMRYAALVQMVCLHKGGIYF